jgi:hypothetical protein
VAALLPACLPGARSHAQISSSRSSSTLADSRSFQKLLAAMMESCCAVSGLFFVILAGSWRGLSGGLPSETGVLTDLGSKLHLRNVGGNARWIRFCGVRRRRRKAKSVRFLLLGRCGFIRSADSCFCFLKRVRGISSRRCDDSCLWWAGYMIERKRERQTDYSE